MDKRYGEAMNMSSYLHIIDGRLRIKVGELKGAPPRALEVESKLSTLAGVLEVSANPRTGNVLVLFDPGTTDHFEILRCLARLGYLTRTEESTGTVGKAVAESLVQSAVQTALERLIFALV